jgi:hypothetical protein
MLNLLTDTSSVLDWMGDWEFKPLDNFTEIAREIQTPVKPKHSMETDSDAIVWLTPGRDTQIHSETLAENDRDVFVKALLDPPAPTVELVGALRRHRMKVG